MIYIALGFGLWFVLVMVAGAALRWSIPARMATLLTGPALACLAAVMLLR